MVIFTTVCSKNYYIINNNVLKNNTQCSKKYYSNKDIYKDIYNKDI